MNYYEHHLADYAQATAHLTMLEDAAYSRLLRWYYANEMPLPADIKQVMRLVRAQTKAERDAVQSILGEFFTLADDGWHQDRADREIARYQDKQRKASASANARWKKPETHTEGNANACANAMRTHTEGNAHQTPDPIHQTPIASASTTSTVVGPPAECCARLARAGIPNPNPANPKLKAMLAAGYTPDELVAIAEEPQAHGKSLAWLLAAAEGRRRDAANVVRLPPAPQKAPPDTWWASHEGIERKGRELGMQARGTETYEAFKGRIFDRIRGGEEAMA